MTWDAAAAVFVLVGRIALWVLPAGDGDADYRDPNMARWERMRSWLRLP